MTRRFKKTRKKSHFWYLKKRKIRTLQSSSAVWLTADPTIIFCRCLVLRARAGAIVATAPPATPLDCTVACIGEMTQNNNNNAA